MAALDGHLDPSNNPVGVGMRLEDITPEKPKQATTQTTPSVYPVEALKLLGMAVFFFLSSFALTAISDHYLNNSMLFFRAWSFLAQVFSLVSFLTSMICLFYAARSFGRWTDLKRSS